MVGATTGVGEVVVVVELDVVVVGEVVEVVDVDEVLEVLEVVEVPDGNVVVVVLVVGALVLVGDNVLVVLVEVVVVVAGIGGGWQAVVADARGITPCRDAPMTVSVAENKTMRAAARRARGSFGTLNIKLGAVPQL